MFYSYFESFFFFFGNSLISSLLNYNCISNVSESILNTSFTTIKQHGVFALNVSNGHLSNTILLYICFITTLVLGYLFTLRYDFIYDEEEIETTIENMLESCLSTFLKFFLLFYFINSI